MKVIDVRSGEEIKIGDVISYPDGEWLRLIDLEPGLFSATAVIEMGIVDHTRDVRKGNLVMPGPITKIRRQVPLTVRWMHPSFLFQHVAFINT